jgi:phosphoribosyl 1,2-cyclic phosphodiesterase
VSLRFCSLGSGSTGNATIVEAGDGVTTTRLLVDCGFSLKELEHRLARADLVPADLDAVFVTHEHGDHIGCALTLARAHQLPIWMSRGTWQAVGAPDLGGLVRWARDGATIDLADLQVMPYTVPHDAREPLQLRCTDGAGTLALLTDTGSSTPHLLAHLQRCQAILIECNHDPELLAASSYPASLKARIGGAHGHLSNSTAAEILACAAHAGLRHVVAAHLSEQNNHPTLARTALADACGASAGDIVVADPVHGFAWLEAG